MNMHISNTASLQATTAAQPQRPDFLDLEADICNVRNAARMARDYIEGQVGFQMTLGRMNSGEADTIVFALVQVLSAADDLMENFEAMVDAHRAAEKRAIRGTPEASAKYAGPGLYAFKGDKGALLFHARWCDDNGWFELEDFDTRARAMAMNPDAFDLNCLSKLGSAAA